VEAFYGASSIYLEELTKTTHQKQPAVARVRRIVSDTTLRLGVLAITSSFPKSRLVQVMPDTYL
jgi:hypothetical protein